MPPKLSAEERAKALVAYRHEQTVKRWLTGNVRKPSKIVYVSDFLDRGALKVKPRGGGGGVSRRRNDVLVSGTLLNASARAASGQQHRHHRHSPSGKGRGAPLQQQQRKRAKQRNPNTGTPFNHRKQFTAFKRRIHDQRENAMRAMEDAAADSDGETERRRLAHAKRLVEEMDLLYTRLDAAMRAKQYRLAGRLKRRLRNRRFALRRVLRAPSPSVAADAIASDEKTDTHVPPKIPESLPYRNYYPPTTALGLGRHPRQGDIDRRTGRYPRRLVVSSAQRLLREAAPLLPTEEDGLLSYDALAHLCLHFADDEEDRESCSPAPPHTLNPRLPALFVGHYCRNVITDALEDLTFTTLQALYHEQRELKQRHPMHFKARQRYVVGFNETVKHLRAGRVKLVVLAADIEVQSDAAATDTAAKTGVPSPRRKFQTPDEAVSTITRLCNSDADPAHRTPWLTCMSRQRLSYALFAKGSSIACVGLLHAEKNLEWLKALRVMAQGLSAVYSVDRGHH